MTGTNNAYATLSDDRKAELIAKAKQAYNARVKVELRVGFLGATVQ